MKLLIIFTSSPTPPRSFNESDFRNEDKKLIYFSWKRFQLLGNTTIDEQQKTSIRYLGFGKYPSP